MAKLSEWLRIMLGEIARKQDEQQRAAAEQQLRNSQQGKGQPSGSAAR